jgi:hypothetical protein
VEREVLLRAVGMVAMFAGEVLLVTSSSPSRLSRSD